MKNNHFEAIKKSLKNSKLNSGIHSSRRGSNNDIEDHLGASDLEIIGGDYFFSIPNGYGTEKYESKEHRTLPI